MESKLEQLKAILQNYGSCLIAFSGGVDSSLLLKVAHDVLGDRVSAVIVCSQIRPGTDLHIAREIAGVVGADLEVLAGSELEDPVFTANSPERCYHCKKVLYSKLLRIAKEKGLACVLDGTNGDDSLDYRPGLKAANELNIRSPLADVGLTKGEIRTLAKSLGLPNWARPASPCLASRFPYGEALTVFKMQQVDQAEEYLSTLGFSQVRVRHHGNLARLEVEQQHLPLLIARPLRDTVVSYLKGLGFTYVTLDLTGFRSGSMNEVLPKEVQNGSQ